MRISAAIRRRVPFDQYSRRDGRLDIGVLPQRELYGSDGGVHHFQLQADSGAADEWRFGGISGHPGTGCEPCDAGERHSGGRLRDGAVSGSPAYDAGIQPGDIIVKFGTKEIGSFKDLQAQIENSASGVSVSVNVMRKGRDGYTEIPFLVSLRAR